MDKTILIIGANGGIGRAVSKLVATNNYRAAESPVTQLILVSGPFGRDGEALAADMQARYQQTDASSSLGPSAFKVVNLYADFAKADGIDTFFKTWDAMGLGLTQISEVYFVQGLLCLPSPPKGTALAIALERVNMSGVAIYRQLFDRGQLVKKHSVSPFLSFSVFEGSATTTLAGYGLYASTKKLTWDAYDKVFDETRAAGCDVRVTYVFPRSTQSGMSFGGYLDGTVHDGLVDQRASQQAHVAFAQKLPQVPNSLMTIKKLLDSPKLIAYNAVTRSSANYNGDVPNATTWAFAMQNIDGAMVRYVLPYVPWLTGWYIMSSSFWTSNVSIAKVLETCLGLDVTAALLLPQFGVPIYFIMSLAPNTIDKDMGTQVRDRRLRPLPLAWLLQVLLNLLVLEAWLASWRVLLPWQIPSPLQSLWLAATSWWPF